MAAGDLRKRQQARQDARDERRASAPSGITSADAGGSRIPNAEDRVRGERVEATANRWNAAIDAGYKPEDYGYDPVTRQKIAKPVLSPAEATKSRMEMYENQRRSRTGAPDPAAKPDYLTNPDPDKNGIPDSIQAPAAKSATAPAPASKPRVSMIDGRPASEVLKEMRDRASGNPNLPKPFGATREERFTASQVAAKEPAAKPTATPGAPSAEVTKKPDAVATPTTPKPGTSAPPSAPTEPDAAASPGPAGAYSPGSPLKDYFDATATVASVGAHSQLGLAALGNAATRRTDRLVGGATKAWNAATDMTNTANRALRRVGSLEHGLARITKDIVPRATTFTTNAAQEAARLKTAATGARVAAGQMGVETTYDAARAAAEQSKKADRLAHFTKRAGQHGVTTAEKLKTARTVASELSDEAAKLAAKSDKLVAASNKAVGRTALRGAGKLASKVAVPLEVGLMAVEGARLVGSEKHREARTKEFEGYANQGVGASTLNSALNPVAGIYSFGRQVGKLADSSADAKTASAEADRAQAAFDRRQELLRSRGYTKESLAKLSQKERSAILRDIRQRA